MDEFTLREELLKGEDSRRQFKRQLNDEAHLAEEVVAFLNTQGGCIYVGVDDDGSIKGVPDRTLGRLNNIISNAGTQHITPPGDLLTENVSTSDGLVVVINVPQGVDKPYQTSRDGSFWVKRGADKRRVTNRSELLRMFQAASAVYAEERSVSGSSLADLDEEAFAKFYRHRFKHEVPDEEAERIRLLTALRLFKEGMLTTAGVLLFARQPDLLLPEFCVKAVWFKGVERSESAYLDNRMITGTLSKQYEEIMAFLRRWNGRVQRGGSYNDPSSAEIPEIVFEEIVTNALVHRDYFIRDAVKIFIFDDRIEIRSPGTLPNSLTVEQLQLGTRRDRNAILCNIGYELLNYRGTASGILRALAAKPDLQFSNEIEREEFVVTIPVNRFPI